MIERLRHVAHYLVAAALYYSGALALRRRLLRRGPEVCVLALHRILTAQQASRSCSEPAMVITLPTFRELLRVLARHFHVLSLAEFQSGNLAGDSRPSCLLTFDDAWLDTFENAYPALREAGLPAVVFVPTGLIGSGQVFWVERLSLLWRSCGEQRAALSAATGELLGSAPVASFAESVAACKLLPARRREIVVRTLEERFGNGSRHTALDSFMSWEQLLAMQPAVEAGSHTVSHVLLNMEDEGTVTRELRESRSSLQKKTGRPVQALAYPSGALSPQVRERAARAGYQWAFTTATGSYHSGDDPLMVPRYLLQEGNITTPWGAFSPAMLHLRLAGWH